MSRMTEKEAIAYIKAIKNGLHETGKDFPYRDEIIPVAKEALEMAIKALENQPTDAVDRVTIKEYLDSFGKETNVTTTDAVDRQAALEAFGLSEKSRKYGGDHSGYDTLMKYEIQDILEDLPSVTPQPCGDCVSRAEVFAIAWDSCLDLESDEDTREFCDEIKELPSVTPQPKMGRWIEHFDESGKWYECDQCHTDWGGSVNYCPNCGAKMSEIPTEAERSDKE